LSKVVFFDPCCPKPYDAATLRTQGLGGSEASVVRVAEALARERVETWVMQHNRAAPSSAAAQRAAYVSTAQAAEISKPDAVVVLRNPDALVPARHEFPDARLYLWLHDLGNADFARAILEHCAETRAEAIAVSHWYAAHVSDDEELNRRLRPRVIYNPIDDDLPRPAAAFDRDKLAFLSSPQKGLAATLRLFERARVEINADFRLFVANPGYRESGVSGERNVVDLGALPHAQAIEHARNALCVFYPNDVYPETFGLVFAEADAVGTPVLTRDVGAAREILCDPREVCASANEVLARLEAWYRGARPAVRAKPEFLTSNVVKSWLALVR